MKKIILLLSLISITSLKAQTNTFPTTGNVGIGTTTPQEKLEINGNLNLSGTVAPILRKDYGSPNAGALDFGDGTGWKFNFRRKTDGFNFMTISDTGNVGIGTTTPDTKLNVNGSVSVPFSNKIGFTTNDAFTYDGINTAHYGISSANGKVHISGYGGLSFFTNFGERLKINTNGNVGIGTTTPNSNLEVANTANGGKITISTGGAAGSSTTPLKPSLDFAGFQGGLKARITANEETSNKYGSQFSILVNDDGGASNLVERFRILQNGNVGIGTTNPQAKLDVNGDIRVTNVISSGDIHSYASSDSGGSLTLGNPSKSSPDQVSFWKIYNMAGAYGNSLQFWGYNSQWQILNNNQYTLKIGDNGNMALNGKFEAKEVKITTTPTADFVFSEDYDLPRLEKVEQFVKENKHLPEIASAKEMEKEGVNVGEFQIKLLQKIEELTLYSIEQNKRIKELESQNEKILELEKQLQELKAKK